MALFFWILGFLAWIAMVLAGSAILVFFVWFLVILWRTRKDDTDNV